MNRYNISYIRNNIPQTVFVDAASSDIAGRYFMSQEPAATFCGIHKATVDDMKPGKPVMTVPDEFLKNIEDVLKKHDLDNPSDISFHYRMLDRLRSDCEYYLGNGNRYAGHLWVNGDEKGHIELMKALWHSFPADGKPEWLPYEKILDYAKQMVLIDKTVEQIINQATATSEKVNKDVASKNNGELVKE